MYEKPTYEELEKRVKELEKSEALYLEIKNTLYEKEEQLRLMTEQTLMGVVIVQDDKIVYANNAYAALTGYSLGEILQWNLADTVKLIHPDHRDFVMGQAQKKIKGNTNGVITNYQYKGIKKDGEVQWVDQFSKSVIYKGRPADMISMVNIHQRKLAEQELEKSQERYKALFDRLQEGVYIHDFEGNLIDANIAAKKMLGYDKTENPNLNFASLLSPDQAIKALEVINKAKEKGFMDGLMEFRVRRKDGTFADLEMISSVIYRDGKPYGMQGIARDITERKMAEEALRESEERYRALFDRSNDCIFINDFEGNYIDANPASLELLGYEKEEIGKVNMADLLTENQLREANEAMENLSRTGFMKKTLEQHVKRKDGAFVDMEIKASLIHRNGKPYAIQGVGRDITERKRAEEAFKESEERYKALFERSNDCIYINDFDGYFIDANPAALESLGYDKGEITSLNFASLLPEDQLAQAHEKMKEVIETGTMKRVGEYSLKRKDGTLIDMEIKTSVIHRNGKPCAIQGVARDITERKRAEEALRNSEERFRDLYENAPIAYFSTRTENGQIIRFNKASQKLSGYDRNEVLNMTIFDLYSDLPEDRKKAFELYNKLMGGESIRDEEVRIKHKDGHNVWVSYSVDPVKDENGRVFESRSMVIDISERKRLQLQLQEAKKMEAIATLAGGLAHQFNNALSVITGNVDLLKLGIMDKEGIKDCAYQMTNSVKKMTQLTQQLIAYAKGGKYHPVVMPVKDFLTDTLPLLQHLIKLSIRVETDYADTNMQIRADRTQMQMVLSAIFTNAAEAIEEEGVIRISADKKVLQPETIKDYQGLKPGSFVSLVIADDGRGMDKETLNRIFDPFFTTKFQGRGLGMAATYGIIKNHNGWISIDSEEGKGSTVNILLPIIEDNEEKNN